MTNHWRDIRHADLILINGANPAEAHPVGFRWFMKAKLERGAKMIHADPRFTRTSAVADTHLRIRTGSDAAYFGGLINYVLENELYHDEYVRRYTNAAFVVKDNYSSRTGSSTATTRRSGPTTPRHGHTSRRRVKPSRRERQTHPARLEALPGSTSSIRVQS